MSAYKPGTVAVVTDADGTVRTMMFVVGPNPCWHGVQENGTLRCLDARQAGKVRPLVVIDPESGDVVAELAKAMHESDHIAPWHDLHSETRESMEKAMQTALRSLVTPLPDVFSHLVVNKGDATKESLCGKVWQSAANVNVLGKCPDCLSIVNDEEWVA